MILKKEISDFFDYEADASKKKWEAFMKLSIKDRIRKRKTIANVYLDKEEYGYSPENERLFKVTFSENLSDFKEGDFLILHKEGNESGINCTLNTFVDDNSIIISVFQPKVPTDTDLKTYYNTPLLLDKDYVDLRTHVYNPFLYSLPAEESFWEKNILNTQSTPIFVDEDKNEDELKDTIVNFKLELTDKQYEAIVKSMSAKDYYLIQGPPGTGKSFVLSLIILEEIVYFKHKVIVVGPNHMAINNTMEAIVKTKPAAIERMIKIGQSYNAPALEINNGKENIKIFNIQKASRCKFKGTLLPCCDEPLIIGMTPHSLYTSRGCGMKCDTLIIDEAGQMTIPLALMGMLKSKKVIFAGDNKQLSPIIASEKIKKEMKLSAFQKLMSSDNYTMLDLSFRMCEPICTYVSELFYEGNLRAKKKGCGNAVICKDPQFDFNNPIIINNILDNGEQTSDKEATFITRLIITYINNYKLPSTEIAVLTPFRAQAANIRKSIRKSKSLKKEQWQQIAVDTIDKMQGQEREVVILSMTAGNPDYITEMADFLYNPNKLNVAFSRAKSKLIIVGNIDRIKKISEGEYPHIKKMVNSNLALMIDAG